MLSLFSQLCFQIVAWKVALTPDPCAPGGPLDVSPPSPTTAPSRDISPTAVIGSLKLLNITIRASADVLDPVITKNFPDPGLVQGEDGRWYAYATNGNSYRIQIATAPDPLGPWNHSSYDVLPDGGWSTGANQWAPDVRQLDDGSFIMYWTGELRTGKNLHCIGTARSKVAAGPFLPDPEPIVCRNEDGGVIDGSGFKDPISGRRYILYKSDGRAVGNPPVATPIFIQEVAADGATKIGNSIMINYKMPDDGLLVEAPNMVYYQGFYVLIFSSHFYTEPAYDIKWSWATTPTGPFTRGGQLLHSPMYNLTGPGGATSTEDGKHVVFHGWCAPHTRCMYASEYQFETSY